MTPVHYSTSNLYEAAYLLYRGCKLEGINKLSHNSSILVFSHRSILRFVNHYHSYRTLRVSPKILAKKRDELKRCIYSQPLP